MRPPIPFLFSAYVPARLHLRAACQGFPRYTAHQLSEAVPIFGTVWRLG
jgi:hypothetical protein